MGFTMDTSGLSRSLAEMDRRRLFAQEMLAHNAARTLEVAAKVNKPWSNRTGHAVQGIKGTATRSGPVITITLSGSVHYMVYLELAHQKKWAVLWKTMQQYQQRILRGFARLE